MWWIIGGGAAVLYILFWRSILKNAYVLPDDFDDFDFRYRNKIELDESEECFYCAN